MPAHMNQPKKHTSTPLPSAQLRRASFSLSSTGGGEGGGQGHPPFVDLKNNIKPIDRFSSVGKGGEEFIILKKVMPLTTRCSGRGDTLSHAAASASSATKRNWYGGQKWILHRGKNILKINLFVFVFLLLCTSIAGQNVRMTSSECTGDNGKYRMYDVAACRKANLDLGGTGATCVDDDGCLQDKSSSGASDYCTSSTSYCSSYEDDMKCCPKACSTCPASGSPSEMTS